jgi:hypothetical protein
MTASVYAKALKIIGLTLVAIASSSVFAPIPLRT